MQLRSTLHLQACKMLVDVEIHLLSFFFFFLFGTDILVRQKLVSQILRLSSRVASSGTGTERSHSGCDDPQCATIALNRRIFLLKVSVLFHETSSEAEAYACPLT